MFSFWEEKQMKQIQRAVGGLLTLLLLFGAGWFLIDQLQNRTEIEPAQQPAMTPEVVHSVPTPTSTSVSGWETATLEQIQFGKPKIILTDTHSLRIVQWVSDEELLVLRGLNPSRSREAIELLNVQTGGKRFYGEISGAGKPVWLSNSQTAAFVDTNYETNKTIFSTGQTSDQNRAQSGLELFPYLTASSDGDTLLGFEAGGWPPILIDPLTDESRALPFDWTEFMPPTEGPRRHYQASWNPHYSKVAFYNAHRLLIADLDSGEMTEVMLGNDKAKQNHLPLWALEIQWSPDGNKLAVIATTGRLPNAFRWLFVYDLNTNRSEEIDLPADFILNNLAWAPDNRLLLAQGSVDYIPPGYALQDVILIDTVTQEMDKTDLLPEGTLGEGAMAWSPGGKWVAFLCNRLGQDYKAVCFSSAEVEK
jgi:Tol biopolymer transport system component